MEKRRHKGYTRVNKLVTAGFITAFGEIFDELPKSVVAHDLGMNNTRFSRLMKDVDNFVLKDLFLFASKLGLSEQKMLELVLKQYLLDKEVRGASAGRQKNI